MDSVAALLLHVRELRHLAPLLRAHENYSRFSGSIAGTCYVPGSAARNLELFSNSSTGDRRGSLMAHIDRARSPLGSRELQRWLAAPLGDAKRIRERQAAVALLRPGTDRTSVGVLVFFVCLCSVPLSLETRWRYFFHFFLIHSVRTQKKIQHKRDAVATVFDSS